MNAYLNAHPLVAILTSSFLSGTLVALISGFFQLRSRRNDYRNEYFKLVLQRRMAAYEAVDKLISSLKVAVHDSLDVPPRLYHFVFSSDGKDYEETVANIHLLIYNVMSQGLWLSEAVFEKVKEFSTLMLEFDQTLSTEEFGKQHYETIALIRAALESLVARDMLTMHQVMVFLKMKSKACHTFVPFAPKPRAKATVVGNT